mmetsp:Transcript_87210/g.193985  ORF Transcript_87210/g.193985 Transcript_87210/m.193985 type:complete len:377 (+) Transcript_87210:917-2047(+)
MRHCRCDSNSKRLIGGCVAITGVKLPHRLRCGGGGRGSVATLAIPATKGVLLVLAILADPLALAVRPKLAVVHAHDLQRRQHPPEEQVLAPRGSSAHRVKVFLLVERLLADRARHDSLGTRRSRPLRPCLAFRMLREPLRDAIATEEMRAVCELRAAPDNMDLANLADELFRLTQKLVLLHLHLVQVEVIQQSFLLVGHLGRRARPRSARSGLTVAALPAARIAAHLRAGASWGTAWCPGRPSCALLFALLPLLVLLVILLLLLFLLAFLRRLLLATAGVALLAILHLGTSGIPNHRRLLLVLGEVEAVVKPLIVDIVRILVHFYEHVHTLPQDSDFGQIDAVVVESAEQQLEFVGMPPVSFLQRSQRSLPILLIY